jgi:hypothetical protein
MTTTESVVDKKFDSGFSVEGRKSKDVVAGGNDVPAAFFESDAESSEAGSEEDYDSDEDNYDSDDEEYDEELEEGYLERFRILYDCLKLKEAAVWYQHPEKPVEVSDADVFGRNYFTRPSAPVQETLEEEYERDLVMEEVAELKKYATWYKHPEAPVEVSDPTACARCYFDQSEQETFEEAEERALVLKEVKNLGKVAEYYHHPEAPIESTGASAGRSYFARPAASEHEDLEEEYERDVILAELAELKKYASWYQHPEKPVEVEPTAFGRNYFNRSSATDQESFEEAEERAQILADAAAMKKLATDYLHPEAPVVATDPTASARCYFERPSAPSHEDLDEEYERDLIMEELAELKKYATWYQHPEKPVEVDPTTSGRNYFARASASAHEDLDEEYERDLIMEELAELKKYATWYQHPEKPVEVDSTSFGRNYFTRASAADEETFEEAEERAQILGEAHAMKKLATDYLHPEVPVVTTDSTACAHNYFKRPSAPAHEDLDEEYERDLIMEELAELKKYASWYRHPERPVEVDPTTSGRNYFARASAADQESFEDAQEYARVLADSKALKQLSVDYRHPEVPVTSDATACGRNYFERPSAPEQDDDAAERDMILKEAAQLKQYASWYKHPEKPVEASPEACGRNYFSRASATEQESSDQAEERARILADARALKESAVAFHHPELPVSSSDNGACGRNYFSRCSAPGASMNVTSSGYAHNECESHHDHDYGHFDMDEEAQFYDMRQSLCLPGDTNNNAATKQSNKIGSDEEGELSRSPSSVMLFTGALEQESEQLRLPTMG